MAYGCVLELFGFFSFEIGFLQKSRGFLVTIGASTLSVIPTSAMLVIMI